MKRLLGANPGTVTDQSKEAIGNVTRATLMRLKNDLASRRLHENAASTSEVRRVVPTSKTRKRKLRVFRPPEQNSYIHARKPSLVETLVGEDCCAY